LLQVSPTEIEGVIRQMDGISDVAVVGVPDDRAGELPRAYIVPLANHSISENEIYQFVDARVAPFKRLAGGIRFIDEIPKNASGKILRKILKQMP
jgi:acyl-coenzyme A synthetase/AMP-(fatty) acid ligase